MKFFAVLALSALSPTQSDSTGATRILGTCPAAGSCFVAHENPGCSDAACCGLVCASDDDCCRFEWDALCVSRANSLCTSACPASGSCFAVHPTPGCEDAECCESVCAKEPLCCSVDWDSTCVSLADEICVSGPCPGDGNCYQAHPTPGCDDSACCDSVCGVDGDCCTGPWDSICVQRARELCGCAGEGNCFSAKNTPSCESEACCSAVCATDPLCCELEWDCRCAQTALEVCAHPVCPGVGSCFHAHGSSGCSDPSCCASVCLFDAECCTGDWDSVCVQRALEVCPTCPGEGDCLSAHEGPGCRNADCCSRVCADDPWCCSVGWDLACATAARDQCAVDGCPSTGSCFSAHANSGCREEFCCREVCLSDPECCDGPWDSLCVERARMLCGNCPGDGRCDVAHPSPGCEDRNCCLNVCKIRPDCCSVIWDQECAALTRDWCGDQACPSPGSCFESHSPNLGCDDAACCNSVCLQDPNCCELDGWDSLCVDRANVICRIPPNDDPEGAIPIACGEVHLGTTRSATGDVGVAPCGPPIGAPGVWYRLTGTGRLMTVDTCDVRTEYATRVAVYTGECGRSLTCIVGDDNGCQPRSFAQWNSILGERYWVFVHGATAQTGDFALRLTCPPRCPGASVTVQDPPNGVVDARQPHPLDSLVPLQGIDRFRVQGPVGIDKECWKLREPPDTNPANEIIEVIEVNGIYTLFLLRPLTPGAVTTLAYADFGCGFLGHFTAHPGNVGGAKVADSIALQKLVACLNGVDPALNCPWGLYSSDLDHSGALTPFDLMRGVDLLNGADLQEPWNGTDRPEPPPCP